MLQLIQRWWSKKVLVAYWVQPSLALLWKNRERTSWWQSKLKMGLFVQDQDEAMEQYTSDQLRRITDDNAVEDQEVHREDWSP
jgi:hypothetical protein